VGAVVVRIESPGGSTVASEKIWHALARLAKKKPVVASLGSMAASGGYYAAAACPTIVATPTTVTGSIGVFALLPHAHEAINKLGVHAEGVTTTWLGAAGDPRREPDPRFLGLMQTSVDHIYADFIGKVAEARKTTPQHIDEVAQGRVWTGAQALERGLVDSLGGLDAAIASAALRAKLANDKDGARGFRVTYIDREAGRFEQLLEAFGASAAVAVASHFDLRLAPARLADGLSGPIRHDLGWLSDLMDGRKPFAAVTHCLCDSP
jgi:protease-4